MPDRPALLRHLDEAFELAQLAATSLSEAESLVAAAYTRAGAGADDRFVLLRALVRLTEPDRLGVPVSPAPGNDWAPGPSEEANSDPAGEGIDVPKPETPPGPPPAPVSVLRARVGRDLLDRYLLVAFTGLPVRQRLTVALSVGKGRSPADAATILECPAEEVAVTLVDSDRRLRSEATLLAPESERGLLDAASMEERPVDAVERQLDRLFALVPTRLVERLTPKEETGPVPPPRRRPANRFRTAVYTVLLIATAGMVGYAARQLPVGADEPKPILRDAVELALQAAGSVRPLFETDRPEEAEQYVRREMGWRVTVPTVQGARLTGVGIVSLTDSARVPVLIYSDPAPGEPFPVFVLTYAFLDGTGGRVVMDRGVLQQIQVDGHFDVYDAGSRRALIFRNRDDIFLAVTPGSAQALRDRVRFPL